jgi:nucleotide-binding universal stress UspA family protein
MHKIFIPVDGSASSERATRHAVALATQLGQCTLVLAHAHEAPLIYGEIAVYVPKEKMASLQREHSEEILKRLEPILTGSGVPYEKEVLVGPVASVLAERAAALGCDAIVMGTHGMTPLGNMLMGSVASKVAHLSRLPITLVR